jgi:uncharacterized membrane-anchored protein YhcB (DUF1043 family)
LLKAVLGPLLGPAGWIVLGAGVVAALVAVLAGGKRNDLEGAAKEAAAAIGSASDKNALHGALVEFSNYLDGEAKTKVQGYAEAIRTATGDLNALKGEALAASKDALRSQLLLEREDILHRLKTLPRGATPDLFDVEPQLRMLEERFARTGVVVDLTWDAATRTIKGVGDNVVLAGNAQLDVLESLYQVQQQLRGNASEIVGDLNQQLADVDTRLSRLDSLFAPTPTNPDPERPPVGTQKTTEDPTLKWVQQVQAAFDLLSDKLRASKLELGDYLDQSGVLLDRLANEYQYVQNEAAAGNIPANLANQRAAAILAASNKITDALRRAREDAVKAAMEASSAVATVAAIPDDLPTVLDIPLDVRYAVEEGDAARLQEFIERELFGNRPFGLAAIPDAPLPVNIPLDVRYAIENDLELNDRLLAMLFGRGPATIVSIPDDPLPVEIPLDVRYAVESGDAAALERLITEQLSGPLRAIPRPRPLIEVGAAGLEMGRNLRAAGTELERVRALYDLGEVSATDLTDAMQRYRTALEAVIAFEGGAANASLVWLQALRAIREELDPLTDLTKRTGQALDQARARLKATGDYEAYLAEQSSILENAYVTLATSGFDGAAEAAERYLGQLKAVQAEQAALKQSAETLKGLQGIVKGFLEGVQLRFGVAQELTQIEALGQAFGKTFNVAEAKARAYQAIIEKLVRANPDAVGTASPAGLEIQVWVNRWQEAQREAAGQFGDALKALKVGEALASGFISIVRAAQSGDAAGVVGGAFGLAAEVANLFGLTGQFVSQVLGVAGGIISGIVDLATRQAREAAAKARRDAEFSYELAGVSNDANARTRESKNETARISNAIGQLEYLRKRAQNDILAVNSDALARTIELRNKAIELGIPQEQIKWALDAIERAAQAEIDEIKARLKDELKGYLGVSAADIRGMLETAFTDLETRPLGESLKSTILEAARTALIRSFNDSQVFREFQGRIGDLIETYVSDGRLSPAELDAIIKEVEKFEESTKTHQEAIEAVNRRLEEMGYTVDRVTSQLSNVPSGFKVALERFAALDAMPATGGAVIRPQSIAATTTYLPSARERGGSTLQVSGNTFVLPNVTDAESLLRELRRLEEQSAVAQTGSPVGAI